MGVGLSTVGGRGRPGMRRASRAKTRLQWRVLSTRVRSCNALSVIKDGKRTPAEVSQVCLRRKERWGQARVAPASYEGARECE